jgi:DNA-binding transcriptional ArsR family regulator
VKPISIRPQSSKVLLGAAPIFAALGDATRLKLVARLCDAGPLATARLAEGASVSRQAVSKHLEALQRAGVVRSGRAGRERIWRLETRRLAEIHYYLEQISSQWDAALLRLRAVVESDHAKL